METDGMINFEETPGRTNYLSFAFFNPTRNKVGGTTTHFQCPIPRINSKMKSNTLIPPVTIIFVNVPSATMRIITKK
jgi:hypothetical protein